MIHPLGNSLATPADRAPRHDGPAQLAAAGWKLGDVLQLYASIGESFERDMAQYGGGHGGLLISRPDLLLMARPVVLADLQRGEDRWLADHGAADAWFVRLLVGTASLDRAVREMPYYLPRICWYRAFRNARGSLRFYRTETVIQKMRN
jgi:hypothetical protein